MKSGEPSQNTTQERLEKGAIVFRGEYEHSLDEKGRILLPVKFRDELGTTVVLARGGYGQINLFPKPYFEQLERRIEESGDLESVQQASRFLAASLECDVDRQGRIVIPSGYRRDAQLGTDVIITGNRKHVEIWNPELWRQAYQNWVKQSQDNPDDRAKLRDLGLTL